MVHKKLQKNKIQNKILVLMCMDSDTIQMVIPMNTSTMAPNYMQEYVLIVKKIRVVSFSHTSVTRESMLSKKIIFLMGKIVLKDIKISISIQLSIANFLIHMMLIYNLKIKLNKLQIII